MKPETMVLLSLCVAGVAHLLVHERGPFGHLQTLRQMVGVGVKENTQTAFGRTYITNECYGENELARMLCCTVCCSFWLALVAVIAWHLTSGEPMSNPPYALVSFLVIFQLSRLWQRLSTA